jgi:formate dehydrogenase subunit beta
VENGETLKAIQSFLRGLLESGAVGALLVPMRTPAGAVTPALVSDPALLDAADPLAPVMPSNAATWVGKLSVRQPRAKVGAVMRSCELRALVELVKLQQANLDDLTLIAVDCAGTYEVARNEGRETDAWRELYANPESPHPELRIACQMCEQPVYEGADATIELLGSDLAQGIPLTLADDGSAELAEKLGYGTQDTSAGHTARAEVIEKLLAARTTARDAEFAAIQARLDGEEGLIGVFDTCVRCHNCMTVCPICYCKTCVFKSTVFEHEPMQYLGWANQKGAYRLPADTMLFHLTRLNHMVLSCVGCGMCTQACPADLPVGSVFRAIGQQVQGTFDYLPGRTTDEPLPLITFKENEWLEVGEG